MGTTERGVPPNCPNQNGDIPASAQPNPGLFRLSLSLCQTGEPVTLKSGCVTALICLGTWRCAFWLFKLLRIQRSQALPRFFSGFPSIGAK